MLVPSIVPAFVMMLPSVRTVSATDWLALMIPLVWLTRNMFAPPPIAPAPEIVLSTLVSVFEAALPKIWLSELFDIVSLPPPCSVTFWLAIRICVLPVLLVWFSLISTGVVDDADQAQAGLVVDLHRALVVQDARGDAVQRAAGIDGLDHATA